MPLRVIVEADGGSRGNPGPAGYGAVVRDAASGEVLREVAAGIGVASNNVAEYRGLIAGLTAAAELGADDLEVRMDSLLVVNQMSSVWKVKHEAMRPLASEAAGLVRRFGRVTFVHVPRERNTHADRLANEAMDAAAAGREWVAGAAPEPSQRRRSASAPAAPPSGTAQWVAAPGALQTVLLRHGETALSPQRRFSGRGDPELSERGQAQAAAAAARLARDVGELEAVVTSPLLRANATAQAVADVTGAKLVVDDELVETDFGEWEGRTWREVRDGWPDLLAAWTEDATVAPPGGESFAAVFDRVSRARDRLLATYTPGTVVVVSHVTPIKVLLCEALGAPAQALFRVHLDIASLSRVDFHADGSGTVRVVNDTQHLLPDLLTVPRS